MRDLVEGFQRLLAESGEGITGELDLLLSQLPDELANLLRLCAIPHAFDEAVIRVLDPALDEAAASAAMADLAQLSVIGSLDQDLCVHDRARAALFGQWLHDASGEFAAVSRRLHDFFRAGSRGKKASEREIYKRRALFHLIAADQTDGFAYLKALFRKRYDQLRVSDCAALLNMAKEYDEILTRENRLTLEYLEALAAEGMQDRETARARLEVVADAAQGEVRIEALRALARMLREQREFDLARGRLTEATLLMRKARAGDQLRAQVLLEEGYLARDIGQLEMAESRLRRAAVTAKQAGAMVEFADALNALGGLMRMRNDPEAAIKHFIASLSSIKAKTQRVQYARVLSNLADAYADGSEWAESESCYRQSLTIAEQSGDVRGQARAMKGMGRIFRRQNRNEEAWQVYEKAEARFMQVGDRRGSAAVLAVLGRILRERCDERADDYMRLARQRFREARDEDSAANLEREDWKRPKSMVQMLGETLVIVALAVILLAVLVWLVQT